MPGRLIELECRLRRACAVCQPSIRSNGNSKLQTEDGPHQGGPSSWCWPGRFGLLAYFSNAIWPVSLNRPASSR